MKTIFLVRHGKADEPWDYESDFERPLIRKGKLAVTELGKVLRKEALIPELIVASPALRTAQTARLLAEILGLDPDEICYEAGLYPGSLPHYRESILKWSAEANGVMLVGHNPILEQLAAGLSNYRISGLPTSGCAVFEWSELLLHEQCSLRFHYLK